MPSTPIDLIQAAGFYEIAPCRCGGVASRRYKLGDYIITLRTRTGYFKLKKKNEVLYPLQSITNLQTALDEVALATTKV